MDEYRVAREGAGVVRLDWRQVLDVGGKDAAAWLHNLTTNDVKGLKPGQGCLAAFATRQGKMIALARVMKFEECFLVDFDAPAAATMLAHFQKFIVMERVDLKDNTPELMTLFVCGPKAPEILLKVGLKVPSAPLAFTINGHVLARRFDLTGDPGFDLLLPPSEASALRDKLIAAGARPITHDALEILRIENGFPRWGADMSEENLPMEVGLEALAISYTKGCYVGQEVIQRVKTYSEVPKRLVGFAVDGGVPRPGDAVTIDGKEVGRVTSATFSPGANRTIALGFVKKEFKEPGTRVMIGSKPATVAPLPFESILASGG